MGGPEYGVGVHAGVGGDVDAEVVGAEVVGARVDVASGGAIVAYLSLKVF